jgi:membrane-associated phospholipid phosphatase
LSVDDALVVLANRLARRWTPGRMVVSALARWLAGVEIALMVCLALGGRRESAVRMLAAVTVVYAASEALGVAWPRARPFNRVASVVALAQHDAARSFPSRHVASGLAMATIGRRAHPQLGGAMSTVAMGLGLSRVAAGLHYPTDIVGGVVLGYAVGRALRP